MNSLDSKKTSSKSIFTIAASILLCVVMFFLGRCSNRHVIDEENITHDTIYITHIDTFEVIKDSIHYKTITKLDTLYLHDTILIREQKEYEDSLSHIWLSGIDAELDSIHYFIPYHETIIETQITKTVHKKSGWGVTVGPYVGFGAAIKDNVVYVSPEIGIGVSVGWTWNINKK